MNADTGSDTRIDPSNADSGIQDVLVQLSCGDGQLDPGEKCDANVNGVTCLQLEFLSGELACGSDCTYDTSNCVAPPKCNNDVLDPGEECDPSVFEGEAKKCPTGFENGELSCTSRGIQNTSINVQLAEMGSGKPMRSVMAKLLNAATKKVRLYATNVNLINQVVLTVGTSRRRPPEICDGKDFKTQTCESIKGAGYIGELQCEDKCQSINDEDCGIKFVQVASGRFHSCGILMNDHIDCWGSRFDLDTDVVDQNADQAEDSIDVSAGGFHTCSLRVDGSVRCWGRNDEGQTSLSPVGAFTSISVGDYHGCVLNSSGLATCWGWDREPVNGGNILANQNLSPSTPFSKIAAGGFHNCGLKLDGSVECWGGSLYSQTLPQAGPFIDISAGRQHNCGVLETGLIQCWGRNTLGQSDPPAPN